MMRFAKRRSHRDARLFSVNVVFMPVPRRIDHPSFVVFLYLLSLNNWWFDGFLSRFNGFFVWSRRRYRFGRCWAKTCIHTHIHTQQQNTTVATFCCAISLQLHIQNESEAGKSIQQSGFIQTEMEWSGIMLLDIRGEGVRVAGSESLYLYFASSMWRLRHVTVNVYFACWSTNSRSDFV